MTKKEYHEFGENIYHYARFIKKERENIKNDKDLTKRNKEIIFKFCDQRKLKKGLSDARISKLLNKLKIIGRILKVDFDKATQEDIDRLLLHVKSRKDLSEQTKVDYCIILKSFYKWLLGDDREYPKLVRDISTRIPKKTRLPSEILTVDDVAQMIKTAEHTRDKAIISLLADAGLRISELINLQLRNLILNSKDGTAHLIIETGKTNGRRVMIIPSVPYLTRYISSLPKEYKEDKSKWIFVKMEKGQYTEKQITYPSIPVMLRRVAKRSNVKKPISPHNWRRFAATHAATKLTDTQLMLRFGWTKRSTISKYTFMNPDQSDDAYRRMCGLPVLANENSEMKPYLCVCRTTNPKDSLCSHCGRPNSLKVAVEVEETQKKEDTEALVKIKQALIILSRNMDEGIRNELKRVLAN